MRIAFLALVVAVADAAPPVTARSLLDLDWIAGREEAQCRYHQRRCWPFNTHRH